MLKYNFIAKIQTFFLQEAGNPRSRVLDTIYELDPSPNLSYSAYTDKNNLLTMDGIQTMQAVIIQSLAASTFYGKSRNWLDPREQYQKILKELQTAFLAYENKNVIVSAAEFEEHGEKHSNDERKRIEKSTDRELVIALVKRNYNGRYDQIIHMAVSRWFHDFKAPDEAPAGEKGLLLEILSKFPELNDIREEVLNGVYDESPDDDDKKELSDLLMSPIN
jgi:hypothetical protein